MHCNMIGETLVLSLHVSLDLRAPTERPQFVLHDILPHRAIEWVISSRF